MVTTLPNAASELEPKSIPVCSINGECVCMHYLGHVSANYRINEQVMCGSPANPAGQGNLYVAAALTCYRMRCAEQEVITPPKE